MKKFLSILAAAALLAACNPSGTPDNGGGSVDNPITKVSIIVYNPGGGGQPAPHIGQVYSGFTFDGSRIAGYTLDGYTDVLHYGEDFPEEAEAGAQARKYVQSGTESVKVAYDAASKAASVNINSTAFNYDFYFTKRTEDEPVRQTRTILKFDDAGCATQVGDGDMTRTYTYTDGRLAHDANTSADATWSADGDLTKVIVTSPKAYGGYKDTYDIEYSTTENPFVSLPGDPSLFGYSGPAGAMLPEAFFFGLMGRRCTHIPAKITTYVGDMPIVETVSFTKDGQDRINTIKFDRLGDDQKPSGRYTEVTIEWK